MRTAVAAVAVAFALTGCGGSGGDDAGGALDSTETVCDAFAKHARAGLPAEQRQAVVDDLGETIGNADERVRESYAALERTAGGSDSGYRTAADGLAQACFDAGWQG